MSGSQAVRVLFCGLITGVVWALLTALSLLIVGPDFLAAVEAGARHPRADGAVFFAVDLIMGVWAVWIYTALRPRYGPGVRAAAMAGFSWWLLKSLQSAKWVALGFVPVEVTIGPTLATLATALLASLVGAYLYDKGARAHPAAALPEPERR